MTKVPVKQIQRHLKRLRGTDPDDIGKSFGSIERATEKTLPPKRVKAIKIKDYRVGQISTNKNFGK
jgi:hypothetical protein